MRSEKNRRDLLASSGAFTSILSATPSVLGRLGVGGIMSPRPFRARLKTAATSAPGAGALRITAAPASSEPLGPDARS